MVVAFKNKSLCYIISNRLLVGRKVQSGVNTGSFSAVQRKYIHSNTQHDIKSENSTTWHWKQVSSQHWKSSSFSNEFDMLEMIRSVIWFPLKNLSRVHKNSSWQQFKALWGRYSQPQLDNWTHLVHENLAFQRLLPRILTTISETSNLWKLQTTVQKSSISQMASCCVANTFTGPTVKFWHVNVTGFEQVRLKFRVFREFKVQPSSQKQGCSSTLAMRLKDREDTFSSCIKQWKEHCHFAKCRTASLVKIYIPYTTQNFTSTICCLHVTPQHYVSQSTTLQ